MLNVSARSLVNAYCFNLFFGRERRAGEGDAHGLGKYRMSDVGHSHGLHVIATEKTII